jgi:hypothetical protein
MDAVHKIKVSARRKHVKGKLQDDQLLHRLQLSGCDKGKINFAHLNNLSLR